MSENAQGVEPKPQAVAPSAGTDKAATPGKSALAAQPAGARAPLFGDEARWEAVGGKDAANKDAPADDAQATDADRDADHDASADADDASSLGDDGMGEAVHACDSGCAHAQFARMLEESASASDAPRAKIDQSIVDSAVAKWKARKGPAPAQPGGAAPQPAPTLSAPTSDGVGEAGTVGPGQPKGFPKQLGLATWSYGAFTYPKLELDNEQQTDKSWNVKVKPTTSADAATSAVAAPAGDYDYGTQTISVDGKPTKFRARLVISDAAAAEIVTAEQEHLDDITYAYNLTLKEAEKAVNEEANNVHADKKKATAQKAAKEAVKGRLHTKLTANPATWKTMLKRMAQLTVKFRDKKGWHTFQNNIVSDTDVDLDNKTATFRTQPNANVGTHPSSEFITLD